MIVIDTTKFQKSENKNWISSKKYDYIKIIFILNNFGDLTAQQINYYYVKIFNSRHMDRNRVSALVNQRKDIFQVSNNSNVKEYSFNGSLILNKTTKHNWLKKINKYNNT